MLDHAGRDQVGRRVDDAADDAAGREQVPELSVRIDALQTRVLPAAAGLVEVPPGDAVDRGHQRGLLADQGLDGRRGRGQRVRLHRDDDEILRPELAGVVRALRMDHDGLAAAAQGQAIGLHRRQMRTARDAAHLRSAGARQSRRHVPADGAGAEDADLHLSARCAAASPSAREGAR